MNNYNIRPEIKKSLELYIDHRLQPGGFLTAVLENNLMEAFGKADAGNRANLFEITSYVYNEMPSSAWGSPEIVNGWLSSK